MEWAVCTVLGGGGAASVNTFVLSGRVGFLFFFLMVGGGAALSLHSCWVERERELCSYICGPDYVGK